MPHLFVLVNEVVARKFSSADLARKELNVNILEQNGLVFVVFVRVVVDGCGC